MVSQVAKMLGVKVDSGAEFPEKITQLLGGLGEINGWAVLISAASVTILVIGRRLARAIPWALVVLVLATAFVTAADLGEKGVAVLGEVPAGPPTFTWPVIDLGLWLALLPSAIALTMVATAEGLLISRAYSEKNHYPFHANRDLFAFGLANVASGAQGGFAVGSSASRTAAMDQAGSRTQLPSFVLAIGTLLLLVFGTALLADIPSPAIGAIVAVAILPLLGAREFASLWRKDRFEFAVAVRCFLVTLLVGAIPGILFAFVLALINLAKRAANPAIDVLKSSGDPGESLLDDAPTGEVTAPGVLVIRLGAPLFFANASVFADAVKNAVDAAGADAVHHVVLDMEAVNDIDITGAESFTSLVEWLDERQIAMAFSRVREPVRSRMRSLDVLGDQTVFATNREAIAALVAR